MDWKRYFAASVATICCLHLDAQLRLQANLRARRSAHFLSLHSDYPRLIVWKQAWKQNEKTLGSSQEVRTGQAALGTPLHTLAFEAGTPGMRELPERKERGKMGQGRTADRAGSVRQRGHFWENRQHKQTTRQKESIHRVGSRPFPPSMTVPLPSRMPATDWQRPREHLQP